MLNVAGGNSGRYCRALRRCSSSGGSGSVYYRTGNYSTLCRDYSYGEPHFSIRKLSDAWKLFGKSDLYLSSVCSFWKRLPSVFPTAIQITIHPIPFFSPKRLAITANTFTTSTRAIIQPPKNIPKKNPVTPAKIFPKGTDRCGFMRMT